jgi:hypothetical protein
MNERITRNIRVHVTGGPYKGRSGLAIRPDGKLRGKDVWLVKLDGAFFGAAVETGHMIPSND